MITPILGQLASAKSSVKVTNALLHEAPVNLGSPVLEGSIDSSHSIVTFPGHAISQLLSHKSVPTNTEPTPKESPLLDGEQTLNLKLSALAGTPLILRL